MRIAFYSDHRENVAPQHVVSGEYATSGSLASVNAFLELGPEHSVDIFHRLKESDSPFVSGQARWISVKSGEHFADILTEHEKKDGSYDIIVVRNHPELLTIASRIKHLGGAKIALLNNDLAPNDIRRLIDLGVHRFVVRSPASFQTYNFYPFRTRVEVVLHSLPHVIHPKAGKRSAHDVMWVGATREEKGFHHVLRAWPLVRSASPTANLHVFGSIRLHLPDAPIGISGALTPEFEAKHLLPILKGKRPEEIGIIFHGPRPKDEIAAFASTARVGVVNPNIKGATETFCISAVELQAAGCPCVGGGAGGLLHTIRHKESGLLVFSEKPKALATAITRILKDDALWHRLSQGAQLHSRAFLDLKREAADWNNVFHRTVADAASPSVSGHPLAKIVAAQRSDRLSRVAAKLSREFARFMKSFGDRRPHAADQVPSPSSSATYQSTAKSSIEDETHKSSLPMPYK